MATYSSFKKISSEAIVNLTIQSADIGSDAITSNSIQNTNVPATAISGTVTSAKIAPSIDISGKAVTYRQIVNTDLASGAGITGSKLTSGAITANLEYTPINQAGSTTTGQLLVPAGSNAAPNITFSSDTTSGINITNNNVAIVAGGLAGININSAGYITRPNHPAFAAAGTTGWLYAPSYGGTGEFECGNIMGWTTAHQTGGANFANDPGRFTAPVAGHYKFSSWWYMLNDANTPPNYVHTFIRKNNSRGWMAGGRSPYNIYMHQNTNSYPDGSCLSQVINMNAGDFVSNGIVWHGNSSRMHSGHHIFSGYLIS